MKIDVFRKREALLNGAKKDGGDALFALALSAAIAIPVALNWNNPSLDGSTFASGMGAIAEGFGFSANILFTSMGILLLGVAGAKDAAAGFLTLGEKLGFVKDFRKYPNLR